MTWDLGSPPGPAVLDHVVVAAITLLLPIHDLLFWYPRLLRAEPIRRGRARTLAYLEGALVEWGLAAAVLIAWIWRGRDATALGLGNPSGWGFYLAAALAICGIAVVTRQRLALTRDPDEDVRRTVLDQIESLRPLLPHTRGELRGFVAVSVTAGICEELLFRGYLLWYLASLVPTPAAIGLGAALFGMAHAYQGLRGIVQTALVGLGLAGLYVVSGSLWVPMILHAFLDVNSGLLAYAFLREPERPRMSGTDPPRA